MTTLHALRRTALPIALVLSFALAGCASTGLDWVREPESGGEESVKTDFEVRETASRAAPVASRSSDSFRPSALASADPEARRRLDHVVSLGETAAAARAEEAAGPAPQNAPVVINIHNYVDSSPGYGFVSSFDSFEGRAPRHRASNGRRSVAPAASRVGQDFPAPPNFGPAFPFRTAPANPWRPAR